MQNYNIYKKRVGRIKAYKNILTLQVCGEKLDSYNCLATTLLSTIGGELNVFIIFIIDFFFANYLLWRLTPQL